jgi:hypothetical protein
LNVSGTGGNTDESTNHLLIENNLFDNVGASEMGGGGRLWQLIGDPSDVAFVHNTGLTTSIVLSLDVLQKLYVTMRDNIVTRGEYGIFGSGQSEGRPSIAYYLRHSTITHNVIVGAPAQLYPDGNFFPSRLTDVGFVDLASRDYRLTPRSRYRGAATDGRDIGVDVEKLNAATTGVAHR